jgi:hypothetical protein
VEKYKHNVPYCFIKIILPCAVHSLSAHASPRYDAQCRKSPAYVKCLQVSTAEISFAGLQNM